MAKAEAYGGVDACIGDRGLSHLLTRSFTFFERQTAEFLAQFQHPRRHHIACAMLLTGGQVVLGLNIVSNFGVGSVCAEVIALGESMKVGAGRRSPSWWCYAPLSEETAHPRSCRRAAVAANSCMNTRPMRRSRLPVATVERPVWCGSATCSHTRSDDEWGVPSMLD